VVSLKESIDTTTATGKLMFTMNSAFAQFERDIIAERTKEGLKSARSRGKVGGRKKKDSEKVANALTLYDSQNHSVSQIEKVIGVSKATLYRRLKDRNKE
jgi:DNA invertase Pin-like site-specific DNA recombinase